MSRLVRDLVTHKGHANAAVLAAVRQSAAASTDREVLALLHHMLVANRFWICAIRRVPFVHEREAGVPPSPDALAEAFSTTQDEERAWMASAADEAYAEILADPRIPAGACSVAEAFVQVCMHSHGHRAQIARMLRALGAIPPQTDFIAWLQHRPEADWSSGWERPPG